MVYLQHGLVDSSDTWVVNNESLAPAFHLANRGFDVWVGNSRGNRYSHRGLSPSVVHFWNFTFHDMAMGDLPGAFSYIRRVTGRKVHYIGHSQGTLQMFIALSRKVPEVVDNLLSFNAFGPVAYQKHQTSALTKLSKTKIPEFLAVKLILLRQLARRYSIFHKEQDSFRLKHARKSLRHANTCSRS